MKSREEQVASTLIEFADTLVSDYDLFGFLEKLMHRSMAVIGADGGGVMLRAAKEQLQPLAWSNEAMGALELFELEQREGPCLDSYRTGKQVVHHDLAAPSRWPVFAPAAVEEGFRSVLAIPMRLRGEVIGALNLYREKAGAIEPSDVLMAQAFADMATIGIVNERTLRMSRELSGQLQGALNSRILIEQAKGMLAERGKLTTEVAFRALRQHARNGNRSLRAVAEDVVSGALGMEAVLTGSRPPATGGGTT